MPRTVLDAVGYPAPATWKPEPCPDLDAEPWADAPWTQRIDGRGVDRLRTQQLARADVNMPIDLHMPTTVFEGSTTGFPYQLVDATTPRTAVWDLARSITWSWFRPMFPIEHVPLPPTVRREGDPGRAWDQHAYLLDATGKRLWEMILLDNFASRFKTWGQADWTVGYNGSGPGLSCWDLAKPWDAPGQPRGVVAAGIPHLPHFVRADELARGEIRHAMFFALPVYAKAAPVGYARGSDGTHLDHPLRAGDRLRLPRTAVEWFAPGTPERVVAEGLHRYGMTLGDTGGTASIAVAQDPRLAKNWQGMGLRLADFEVVQP